MALKNFFSIGKSNIVHLIKDRFGLGCFYVRRSPNGDRWTHYETRPRHMRVCDQCQRLEKAAKKAARMAAKAK